MNKLVITMVDGTQYEKEFEEKFLAEAFLSKLELFNGLFIDLNERDQQDASPVRINPKYIMRVEEETEEDLEDTWEERSPQVTD